MWTTKLFSETDGKFDLSYFDIWNQNQRPFVWRLQKVGMFDSDLFRLIRPTNGVEQNIIRTKSTAQIIFD